MAKYANVGAVPLSLAVFLATDHYDYNDDKDTISVTTLLKPLRQIILATRVPENLAVMDIEGMLQNRIGAAIHDGIERAWLDNYKKAMLDLGIPQRVIDQIVINPPAHVLPQNPDLIPVYLEQRASRKVTTSSGRTWKVTGKYDFVAEGMVEDFKSTSTFTAVNSTNDLKYSQQGSMYRWLNPEIITADHMAINWIFTDWQKARAMQDPAYPQKRFQRKLFPLMTVPETQAFVIRKLELIEKHWNDEEADIPECDDADLWRSAPVFKYYANGDTNAARSTKNFDTMEEARRFQVSKNGAGAIKEVPGQAVACRYCPGFVMCSQKDRLIAKGDLVL